MLFIQRIYRMDPIMNVLPKERHSVMDSEHTTKSNVKLYQMNLRFFFFTLQCNCTMQAKIFDIRSYWMEIEAMFKGAIISLESVCITFNIVIRMRHGNFQGNLKAGLYVKATYIHNWSLQSFSQDYWPSF